MENYHYIMEGVAYEGAEWKKFLSMNYTRYNRILFEDHSIKQEEFIDAVKSIAPRSTSWVIVYSYGMFEIWRKRSEAKRFYETATMMCEGNEADRYMAILWELDTKQRICKDDDI